MYFTNLETYRVFLQFKPFAIKMCKMLENHTQTPATCHNHQFQSVEIESLHVPEAQSIYKFSLAVQPFDIASEAANKGKFLSVGKMGLCLQRGQKGTLNKGVPFFTQPDGTLFFLIFTYLRGRSH